MKVLFYVHVSELLVVIYLASVSAKLYQIYPTSEDKDPSAATLKVFSRHKRQFPGFQNDDISSNGIFFDNDNIFNDFVPENRGRQRPNRPSSGRQRPTTPRPTQGSTTVAIPGMGTPRSLCEDMCLTTPQYDPVCGDNNVTYNNIARYQCAIRCGQNVRIIAYRACPRTS